MLLATLACSAASPASSPSPTATQIPFTALAGTYRSLSGSIYVVNGLGQIVRFPDGWIRQLHGTADPRRFSVGPAFEVASPIEATVDFNGDSLTIGSSITATRLAFKSTDVRIPSSDGVQLAATITEPLSPGPHPAIVVVHGSEPGTRVLYGVWVGLYASLGLTVLTYDKRGNGGSTGRYPGEVSTPESLATFADDAAACAKFLARWPGVDPRRVGFHGGSQGGWTVPLAVSRFPAAAFAVLLSGPAVSVGQQTVWSLASGDASFIPTETMARITAEMIAAARVGYQPGPALAELKLPVLWLNGETDRHVPTALNLEVLKAMKKRNFDAYVFPGVSHGLLVNPTGLDKDDATSRSLAADLYSRIEMWLAGHGMT